MTGQAFGRLTVIKRIENYVSPSGCKKSRWECKCQCGNICNAIGRDLTTGKVLSCGCLNSEKTIIFNQNTKHKYNKYDLSGEYGVGWTFNTNKEFYFDLEDYDNIKDYCWSENKQGYIITAIKENGKYKTLYMHRIILGVSDDNYKETMIDHINHETNNSRKCNLRIVTASQNCENVGIKSNNTSGVPGVNWHSRDLIWEAVITVNRKKIYLGRYSKFDDAVQARKEAEKKYFGEYAYGTSMNFAKEIILGGA